MSPWTIRTFSRSRVSSRALTTASLFLVALFFAPLIQMVGSYPSITAPALVLVGAMMMRNVTKIEWSNEAEAIPAFITFISIIPIAIAITFITVTVTISVSVSFSSVTFISIPTVTVSISITSISISTAIITISSIARTIITVASVSSIAVITTVTGTTINRNAVAVNVAHQGATHTVNLAHTGKAPVNAAERG